MAAVAEVVVVSAMLGNDSEGDELPVSVKLLIVPLVVADSTAVVVVPETVAVVIVAVPPTDNPFVTETALEVSVVPLNVRFDEAAKRPPLLYWTWVLDPAAPAVAPDDTKSVQ